jgi:hypothetical protein
MSHFRYPPTPHSGSIELDDNKSLPPSPGLSEHLTWVIEHHRELERYAMPLQTQNSKFLL